MKKHFGKSKDDGGLSLSTPGKEGEEEERMYEGVRAELTGEKNAFYEEKLKGIGKEKVIKERNGRWEESFEEVYCSREEGLICMEGKCVDCGDEGVKNNTDLKEACDVKDGGEEGSSTQGYSGVQDGRSQIPEITVILGIVSTIVAMF
jgi:hypothetical protein